MNKNYQNYKRKFVCNRSASLPEAIKLEPYPADFEDTARYCPIDPYTGHRHQMAAIFTDNPEAYMYYQEMSQSPDFGEFYKNLSDEDREVFMPSRYDQGFALLDVYADQINEVLQAKLSKKSE